jgi:hypothetical protein
LWVLGDEVEQSVPVDLEFAPWHEDNTENLYTAIGKDIPSGWPEDHDKNQRHLDGHSEATTQRVKPCN